ncbi:type I restriction enzyme S subunit [Curtobacterium sp. AG1037]|uniref:restriction endonuclease subunit S n=1 Tax=Curtobacterium sp. AG1037 TaxID=2183990 RepID=UPI000E2CFB87|nr:restriction endonuclease subunit S [Curtobacterium sp. AG1037]RDH96871.1 type I restriction enzyme S subunit [Curtobacterium sp. AG1037]
MSIQTELLAAPKVPLRYLVRFNPRPSATKSDESCYLPMEAISEFGAVDSSRRRPTSELAQGYSFLADGDVAYAKVTPCFENGKGLRATALPEGHAFATTEITVMRPSSSLDSRYLAWTLQSEDFRGPGEAHMSGAGGLKRVPESYAARFRVRHPSIDVQRAVADYLDRETAQIDAFIAKNEELITLLTERRTAQIDALLSSVASEQHEVKINWLFTFHNGDRGASYPSRDEYVSEGVPFINAGHLKNGAVDYNAMNYIPDVKFAEMGGAKLRAGDILFCLRGSLGKLGVFDEDGSGALASSLVALRRRNPAMSVTFFAYLLQSSRVRDAIDLAQTGSAQPNLSVEQLAQFRLSVPGVAAQHEIARKIELITESVDEAIEIARCGVSLAQERRAELITATVTGKIDVEVAA